MPTILTPVLAEVLARRGFAWCGEVALAPDGDLPVLDHSGATVGKAAILFDDNDVSGSFTLSQAVVPLSRDGRTRTLIRLAEAELELLTDAIGALDDAARRRVLEHADEEQEVTRVLDSSEQTLQGVTRRERTTLIALLRTALEQDDIGAHVRSSFGAGLKRVYDLRERVFHDSIRLAASVISQRGGHLEWSTAVLAACQGLEIALDRFEPSRGFQFSTYALWWIRQAIDRYRENQSATLRLPIHAHERLQRYRVAERELWLDGRRPSTEAVLEALGSNRELVARVVEHLRSPHDARLHGDASKPFSFGERVLDPALPSMWAGAPPGAWPLAAVAHLRQALATLPGHQTARKAKILDERLAIGRPRPATLAEIGHDFGVSRERIRQLQAAAVAKLRLDALGTIHDVRPWHWRART